MVEAADNIFYALSDNFPISSAPSFALNSAISNQSACNIDAVSYEVDFFTVNGFNESTTFTASGNPPGSSYDFMPSTLSSDGIVMLNITGLTGATPGDYTITVTGTSNSQTKTIDLMLTVVDGLCASVANTDYQTSTTLVQFGTINNASGKPSGYSDYTNADPTTDPDLTTEVTVGSSYDLFVNQNTDGNFTCITTVWIDWNQNCILEASEAYDLGTAFGTPDGPASNSGLSVLVPTNAVVGNTIMRVTTKYNSGATSCENGHDAEVEDYTITVVPLLSVDEFGSLGGFSVYPNPNNGSFNVELNSVSSNDINISVFDIRGREVFNNIYKASTVFNETIRLDKVQSGIYMLQVSDGLNKHTKKVIIN